jgi:hypothetical protein
MVGKHFVLQLTQHPNPLEPSQTRELITHKQQIAHYSCLFVYEKFHEQIFIFNPFVMLQFL